MKTHALSISLAAALSLSLLTSSPALA